MRLPEARRPSRISSHGAAAFFGGLALLVGLASSAAPAEAGISPVGPPGGSLLCSGRSGPRSAVAALPDADGGWLVVTRDPLADPINPSDGGMDIGLLRLDPSLASLPVHEGPGGSDPCGALLVEGAGDQTPFQALTLSPGRHVVIGRERGIEDPTPWRVFAMGFDAGARALFPDGIVTPADPLARGDFPFAAPDGAGGFFLGWLESAPTTSLQGRVLLSRFDATGGAVWPAPVALSAGTLALSTWSTAVPDGSGGVFVSWLEPFPGDPDLYQPRVQHLDALGIASLPAGGLRLDPDRRIVGPAILAPWRAPSAFRAGASMASGVPAAASPPLGVLALAIDEVPRAHLILADGSRPWGREGRPLLPALEGRRPVDIGYTTAPDGSLRVTWIETSLWDRLVALRLEPDGRIPWPAPVPLLDHFEILERSEQVLDDGSLVVAATVYAPDLPQYPTDLVAQAVDPRGRTRATPAGYDLCREARWQTSPLILTPSGGGPPSVIWSDTRPGPGVDGADAFYTQTLALTSMPRLTATSSVPLRQGGTRDVLIDGDDLSPGLAATLGPGIEIVSLAVQPFSVDGPGDRLVMTVRALPHAAVGPHALTITNPDGAVATVPAVLEVTLDPDRIDIDGSGRADGFDLALLAGAFGRASGERGYAPAADIDGSGLVDGLDLALLAGQFGDRVGL